MAKKKKQYVMVCPQCKSPDIHRDVDSKIQGALGLPSLYVCNKCGHSSHLFPEVEISELEEFEHEVDKKHERHVKKDKTELLDTSYGNMWVRFAKHIVVWKLVGSLFLIFGIIVFQKLPWVGAFIILLSLGVIYIAFVKKRKLKD